ncbi:MAG TPA: energy transducer TonB [Terriglobales bacterium]|nr:energy transducer TonB [Terriglobales bacterium]
MLEPAMFKQATLEDAMFGDSILQVSWAQRSRRSWTTLTSFGLQAVIVGLLLLAPLLRTVGLPAVKVVSTPISVGRNVEPLAPKPAGDSASVTTDASASLRLMQPSRIPAVIARGGDETSIQPAGVPGACAGCVAATGMPDGLRGMFVSGSRPVLPAPPAPRPTVRQFRTSSMLQGSLIRAVQPVYPPLARTARIQGAVVLAAVISKAGTISDLRVVSGHPMLVRSAIDAVSQWRYRPYILNNEAIEVETRITVNFTLAGN